MLKLFFSFQGRLNRSKFWLIVLTWTVIRIGVPYVIYSVGSLPGYSLDIQDATATPEFYEASQAYVILSLISLVSLISAAVRRLHDFDSSGWWALLLFIPGIEFIAYIVIGLIGSQPGTNRYGINPLGVANVYVPGANEEMRVKELKDLATLYEKGLLSEEEYRRAKDKILKD